MPTYLNCPYCPAQSYILARILNSAKVMETLYECPAHHRFVIHDAVPQIVTALDTKEAHDVQTER